MQTAMGQEKERLNDAILTGLSLCAEHKGHIEVCTCIAEDVLVTVRCCCGACGVRAVGTCEHGESRA